MTDKELKRTEYELMECDALLKVKTEQLEEYKTLVSEIHQLMTENIWLYDLNDYKKEILSLIKLSGVEYE